MKTIEMNIAASVKAPTKEIDDRAKVRMGSMSPSFPVVQLRAAPVSDAGKIRMGSMSPAFPPIRPA